MDSRPTAQAPKGRHPHERDQRDTHDSRANAPEKLRRRVWMDIVEERIREAAERGEFDHLPGEGKPLVMDVNPAAAGKALAYSLLKANGAVPPEIALGQEVDADLARVESLMAALRHRRDDLVRRHTPTFASERRAYNVVRARTAAQVDDTLRAAHGKALTLTIIAPAALRRPLVDVEARLRAFHDEFPPLPE